jgi:hypothetical protein
MIMRIGLFITTLIVLLMAASYLSAQQVTPENIQKYDLGRLEKTATLDLVIPFKNSTSSVAHIDSVQSSCACLDSDFEPKILKPGDLGYLNVTINLTSKRGYFLEEVILHTNQLDNGTIMFQFSGYVLSDVEVHPIQNFILVSNFKTIEPIKITLESTKSPLQEAEIYETPDWLVYKISSIEVNLDKKTMKQENWK